MNNFRYKLMQFMQGRYGMDEMFYVLAVIYIALMFVNMFVQSWLLQLLGLAVFVFAVYRFLSRNIAQRTKENGYALKLIGFFKGGRRKAGRSFNSVQNKSFYKRYAQRNDYYFKRCPNCGKTLRLPRVKGKHGTRCPSCGCQFRVNIRRGKK
ncbi:MAG: hypothetical protein LUE12_01695 [Ruminococcus sp.]|nr:hypothetical protein [Ruminococcus sp.]